MRVLFIYPDLSADVTHYTGVVSCGIGTLSAMLRQAGHDVGLYHMISMPTEEEFRERLRAFEPDLIGFSTNSHYARRLRTWAAWARSETHAPVAVGGPHATLSPEEVSSIRDVDFTCIGEGELALLELCEALETGRDPLRIENLWVRNGSSLARNRLRPLWKNLDELPDPDFSLFDFSELHTVRRGLFPYVMSRGCAFSCTYCSVHALRKLSPGGVRFWRFLSPQYAAGQLSRLVADYMPEAPMVQFLDSILFPNRKWLEEFAPLYKERVGKPFSCNLRADFVDRETAGILRDMGCVVVRLGVESGNNEMTTKVLNRGLTIGDIRRAFAILRDHDIKRWSYNMVGLPGEKLRSALETVRLNAEIRPDLTIPFIFYPYPGTQLYERCASEGCLTDREYDHYFLGVTTRQPGFRESDILFVHRFFVFLMRLYALAAGRPAPLRRAWVTTLDSLLTSRFLPRGAIVRIRDRYKRLRHRIGEYLVRRSPRLYRLLGGTDPL